MGRKKPERKPINCLLPYFLHCSSTEIFIFFPIANLLLSAISFSKFWQYLHFVFSFTSVFFISCSLSLSFSNYILFPFCFSLFIFYFFHLGIYIFYISNFHLFFFYFHYYYYYFLFYLFHFLFLSCSFFILASLIFFRFTLSYFSFLVYSFCTQRSDFF